MQNAEPKNDCDILAIDSATNSGWAMFIGGSLLASGEVNVYDADAVVAIVTRFLHEAKRRPVMAIERHPWAGGVALHKIRGGWEFAWRLAGGTGGNIVYFTPTEWRSRTTRVQKKDGIPAAEAEYASRYLSGPIGADEAAAICLGDCAMYHPKMLRLHKSSKKRLTEDG